MTRIATIFQRDGGPVPAVAIARLLEAEDLPGALVRSREIGGGIALGAAVLPRAGDAAGPCTDPESGLWLLLDGRIDNRAELGRRYGVAEGSARSLTDAELLLRCYLAGGADAVRSLIGPFALVVADPAARKVSLYRDPLGCRTLFYLADARRLTASTRITGLLTMPGGSAAPNEVSIARFLALAGPLPGDTFYSGIHEVPPGFVVEASPETLSVRRFDQLRPAEIQGTDADLEEQFLALLAEAVRCRVSGTERAGVLMSGGFDSTALAAVLARDLPEGERLTTISHTFEELASIDESPWIEAMSARWNLDSLRLNGDGAWPLRAEAAEPRQLGSPVKMVYGGLRQRSLELARERGIGILLTGEYGDELWSGSTPWLSDLLRSGMIAAAIRDLMRAVRLTIQGRRLQVSLRATLAYAMRPARHSGEASPASSPGALWMTPRGRELARSTNSLADGDSTAARARALLSPLQLAYIAEADDQAARAGLSVRRPYRDRRLVEFMIAVPPRLLYRPGVGKLLLRRAMRALLPQQILDRRAITSLTPLFERGLGEHEWPAIQSLLRDPGATWPHWVDAGGFWRQVPPCLRDPADSPFHLVVWHCVCVELWRRQRADLVAGPRGSGIELDSQ